jgi:hypothetical protein
VVTISAVGAAFFTSLALAGYPPPSPEAITALIVALTGLVAAITALVKALQHDPVVKEAARELEDRGVAVPLPLGPIPPVKPGNGGQPH